MFNHLEENLRNLETEKTTLKNANAVLEIKLKHD
jgi:hypothetical protein